MVTFCRDQGIPVEVCGKLVFATSEDELPRLHALHERGVANGPPVRLVTAAEAREWEPHVACVAALHSPTTGSWTTASFRSAWRTCARRGART
jgi:L-2-hydroxyglutarate oxidase